MLLNKSNVLTQAKITKNDEFYTRYEDIEKEMKNYIEFFNNKTVYCNCDDYRKSNFVKYFIDNFKKLNLNRLIATCCDLQFEPPSIWSEDDHESNAFLLDVKSENYDDYLLNPNSYTKQLNMDGDFRSVECSELLEESDVIVTNPPFSLFSEFISLLILKNKKFIVLGNPNAVTNKEVFPLIQNNKLWFGCRPIGNIWFTVPSEVEDNIRKEKRLHSGYEIRNGIFYARASAIWYTNVQHQKRRDGIVTDVKFDIDTNQFYDNFGAWNVNKVTQIPSDDNIIVEINTDIYPRLKEIYKNDISVIEDLSDKLIVNINNPIFGVPVTFVDRYSPSQYQILGLSSRGNSLNIRTKVYTIQDAPNFNNLNGCSVINKDGKLVGTYVRMFIRKHKNKG